MVAVCIFGLSLQRLKPTQLFDIASTDGNQLGVYGK